MSPIIFYSFSWRREPRGIGPGRTLTGCPHTHPRASGGPTEPCCTPRRTRTPQVYGAGKSPLSARTLKPSQWHWERAKVIFYSWLKVSLHPCSSLFLLLSVFVCQWLHGEGAALQDARARDPQREPGKPQPRQRLLSGLRQQGVQPGSCPGG